MRPLSTALGALAALSLLAISGAPATAFETKAKQAIVVDLTTGDTLFSKNADIPVPPASMSKLMTVYMVLERLKDGRLSLKDKFKVSEKAWRKGGSKMFVRVNTVVSVEDLLRGIIVQSGNDACIVIAEGLSGSEEAFAAEMTRRGREIGLKDSIFANATGWPHSSHRMSVRDIAFLSQKIIEEFPEFYTYFKEQSFKYNKIKQANRNPLLYVNLGADGLKTGHTDKSGYGLTGSAIRDGRRVIVVLHGMRSIKRRSTESISVMNWAFREFKNYALFSKGDQIEKADVWMGMEANVPLVIDRDLTMTLPRKERRKLKVKVVYDGPVTAPIVKGARIAKLVVSSPGIENREFPLIAGADVPRLGAFGRIGMAIRYLIWGPTG